MSQCIPEQRDRLQRLGRALSALPSVVAQELLTDDPTHGMVLDVTVGRDQAGLPPCACQLIGEHRGTIVDVSRQGGYTVAWVVVR